MNMETEKRRKKIEFLEIVSTVGLNLQGVIEELKRVEKDYSDTSVYVELTTAESDEGICIYGWRLESDYEYKHRVEKELTFLKAQEERKSNEARLERELYEKLRAKYEQLD